MTTATRSSTSPTPPGTTAPATPAKWVEGIFSYFPTKVAFVHPNTKGHKNAADHVSAAILNALGIN